MNFVFQPYLFSSLQNIGSILVRGGDKYIFLCIYVYLGEVEEAGKQPHAVTPEKKKRKRKKNL
jgi:hypothetical protein